MDEASDACFRPRAYGRLARPRRRSEWVPLQRLRGTFHVKHRRAHPWRTREHSAVPPWGGCEGRREAVLPLRGIRPLPGRPAGSHARHARRRQPPRWRAIQHRPAAAQQPSRESPAAPARPGDARPGPVPRHVKRAQQRPTASGSAPAPPPRRASASRPGPRPFSTPRPGLGLGLGLALGLGLGPASQSQTRSGGGRCPWPTPASPTWLPTSESPQRDPPCRRCRPRESSSHWG